MYSNSSLVDVVKISPNRTNGRTCIKSVAIHCMAGHMTVENCGNLFTKSTTGASSNYGIDDDGRVGLYVEEKDRSWCTSSRYCDMRVVTIEVASDNKAPYTVSDKVFNKLILLVTDICKRNNINELKWSDLKHTRQSGIENGYIQVHCDYSNKACPGKYLLEKMPELVEKVNKSLKSSTNVKKKNEYTNSQFIKEVQEALGANVDGIAGNETLSKTITVSNKTNRKHKVVKALQKEFARLGYTEVGNVDGVAGAKFKSAVIHFQKDNGCKQDGIITKGNKTWKKLLGMEV